MKKSAKKKNQKQPLDMKKLLVALVIGIVVVGVAIGIIISASSASYTPRTAFAKPSMNSDKALSSLLENGYIAYKTEASLMEYDGCVSVVKGSRNSGKDSVSIYYFDDRESAKAAVSALKQAAADEKLEYNFNRSGKVIYWGTAQGMKDAR